MSGRIRVIGRQVRVSGRLTSLKLEPVFWGVLETISHKEGLSIGEILSRIDSTRTGPLTSSVRCFAVLYLLEGNGDFDSLIVRAAA